MGEVYKNRKIRIKDNKSLKNIKYKNGKGLPHSIKCSVLLTNRNDTNSYKKKEGTQLYILAKSNPNKEGKVDTKWELNTGNTTPTR